MTRLPVLALHPEREHFKCSRYECSLSFGACVARQFATKSVPHRYGRAITARHPYCALECAQGAANAKRFPQLVHGERPPAMTPAQRARLVRQSASPTYYELPPRRMSPTHAPSVVVADRFAAQDAARSAELLTLFRCRRCGGPASPTRPSIREHCPRCEGHYKPSRQFRQATT